jgi:flagellar hook-associated protein 1 FlgK
MGSLNGLFDLTRSALDANQAALNATANNVANQNTAGYTREVVNFSAGDTVTLSGGEPSSSGPQVTTTSVRDRVLEARVQQQMQAQSSSSAESDVLAQIQDLFSIGGASTSAGSTAIGTALDSFSARSLHWPAIPRTHPPNQAC